LNGQVSKGGPCTLSVEASQSLPCFHSLLLNCLATILAQIVAHDS